VKAPAREAPLRGGQDLLPSGGGVSFGDLVVADMLGRSSTSDTLDLYGTATTDPDTQPSCFALFEDRLDGCDRPFRVV
jgi:hypothetical protein